METALAVVDMRDPEIWVAGTVVAVNSCPECFGRQGCRRCRGTGKIRSKLPETELATCTLCGGLARCGHCLEHSKALAAFAKEIEEGSLGIAEACVHRELMRTERDDQSARTILGVGGAGIGMALGTLVAPGLGTIVGMSMGKMFGDKAGEGHDPGKVRWRQADLLYCLGVVYAALGRKGEASQAWIKAMTLNDKHRPARSALKETL